VLVSHTRLPQHSALSVHVSPVPRQPHVLPALHTSGEQQSPLVVHDVPLPAQPQVEVFESHSRAPQQSRLPVHPWPLEAQPQVPLTHRLEQHSDADEHAVPSLEQLVPASPAEAS
jgi:hypothetical protein